MADETPQPESQPAPSAADIEAKLRVEYDRKLADDKRVYEAQVNQQVAQYLQAQQQQQAQPTTTTDDSDDPEAIITRAELRKALDNSNSLVAGAITESQRAFWKSQRATNRAIAAQSLPEFGKFAADIDKMVDQLEQTNPQLLGNPGLYSELYEVVAGKHALAEQRAAALAAKKRAAEDADAEGDEIPPQAAAPTRSPMPLGDGGGVRVRKPRQPTIPPGEENYVAHFFGTDEAGLERYRTYARGEIPDDRLDFLGLRPKRAS